MERRKTTLGRHHAHKSGQGYSSATSPDAIRNGCVTPTPEGYGRRVCANSGHSCGHRTAFRNHRVGSSPRGKRRTLKPPARFGTSPGARALFWPEPTDVGRVAGRRELPRPRVKIGVRPSHPLAVRGHPDCLRYGRKVDPKAIRAPVALRHFIDDDEHASRNLPGSSRGPKMDPAEIRRPRPRGRRPRGLGQAVP